MDKINQQHHLDILRISDSQYKETIKGFIESIAPKEILIHAAFNMNVATLLATFLFGFGLNINAGVQYVLTAYCLIGVAVLIKLAILKKSPKWIAKAPLFELIDDLTFLCAIPIIYAANQKIDLLLVIYFVLSSLFVTSFFSIKYLHNYLIVKFMVFVVCVFFVFNLQYEYLSLIYIIFSMATVYILLMCLACWIHVRQIRLYHLNASYIHVYERAKKINQDLVELKNKRDKVIRHIGHDLRQPINAVNYALFNIHSDTLSDMQSTQINNAHRSIGDINAMIEEVLQISTDEKSHALTIDKKYFVINDLLTALYNEHVGLASQKGSVLRVSSCAIKIYSDANLVARIIRNFLSNAIKYGNGCDILLGVRRRENGIDIQVIDQGPGIKKALLSKLFNEYVQVPDNIHADSIGLGLNVTQHIASMLGADVNIKSDYGKGTLCTLHLNV